MDFNINIGLGGPADGYTPYVGNNGNWWYSNIDTGIKADYSNEEAFREQEEVIRASAELLRVSEEQVRVGNENSRKTNENLRKNSETARELAELKRNEDEDVRRILEEERVNNESSRVNDELNRSNNELVRTNNESIRMQQENARKDEETKRSTNEQARIKEETLRKQLEEDRKTAETNRNNSEDQRKEAERLRAEKDAGRDDKIEAVETKNAQLEQNLNENGVAINGGEFEFYEFEIGGYNTSSDVISTVVGSDQNVKCYLLPCRANDKFKIKGTGGFSFRLWCFTDAAHNKIAVADGNAVADDIIITAPVDGFLFVNYNKYKDYVHYVKCIGKNISKKVDELDSQVTALEGNVTTIQDDVVGYKREWITFEIGKRIATNVGIGNTVSLTMAADTAKCAVIPCKANDIFLISGKGAETARLWCFTDSKYACKSVATGGLIITNAEIYAPVDGFLIVNLQNQYTGTSSVFAIKKSILEKSENTPIILPIVGDYAIIEPTNIPTNLSTPNNRGQVNKIHTYAELLSLYYDKYISNLSQQLIKDGYLVTKKSLGKDSSGQYDLFEYDFCPKNYNKVVLLSAGMNACETGAIYGLGLFIRDVLENNSDTAYKYLRDNVRFKIIPSICPWAFEQPILKYANFNNVNINRNFDYNGSWAALTDAGSLDPNSTWAYKGTAPDSEAETKILKQWINTNGNASSLWLDCHQDIGGSRQVIHGADMAITFGGFDAYLSVEWEKMKQYYAGKGVSLTYLVGGSGGSYPKTNYAYDVCNCPAMMIEQWASLGYMYGSTGIGGNQNEGVNADAPCLINYMLMIRGSVLGALIKPLVTPTKKQMEIALYQSYLNAVGK